jgi:hypothetical protein
MLERKAHTYCRFYIGLLLEEMGLKSVLKRKFTIKKIKQGLSNSKKRFK